MQELARADQKLGFEYPGVTDHTRNLRVARGLDEQRLQQQIQEIERSNAEFSGFRLLKGSEVDIRQGRQPGSSRLDPEPA